jgi:hypothetical protein
MMREENHLAWVVALLVAIGTTPGCGNKDDSRDGQGSSGGIGSSSGGTGSGDGGTGGGDDGSGETGGDSGGDDDGSDGGDVKFDVPPLPDVGGGDDSECPCAPNADLIFVLSDSAELWAYDPPANTFTQFGAFNCGPPANTFSMGVSREAVAWVMYRPPASNGDIFHVAINNANQCDDPGYTPGQEGFFLFGMAFASNSEQDPCDKLYAHTFDDIEWSEGPGVGMLGVVDPDTLQLTKLGDIDYNGGELTGTGDGRLYAFAGVPDAKLVQYDKDTAQVVETLPLSGLQLTYAFAFAFWGGDFYFFTENGMMGSNSKVTHLDYDESEGAGQALTTINTSAPIRVVGAGVSTCAPLEPPG